MNLITVDEDAAIDHYKLTGEVLPGMRIIRTATEEGSNVTELEIIRDTKGR